MAVFEMLLCQHSKKGPPFMGSALAAHKQYLNGLVVSARKCAGPIPAKNCTSCRK